MEKWDLMKEIVAIYRGWHLLEQQNGTFMSKIAVVIDDLASININPKEYQNNEQVKADLDKALIKCIDVNTFWAKYTQDKLNQSLMYLNQLQTKAQITPELIEKRGTKWYAVSDEEIEVLFKAVSLNKLLLLNKYEDTTSYFEVSLPFEVLTNKIRELSSNLIESTKKLFAGTFPVFQFDITTVAMPASWRMMVNHSGGRFKLVVNLYNPFTLSVVENLSIHEVCGHMVHLAKLQQQSDTQMGNPHLLCFAIHTQDAYLLEGVAQLIAAANVHYFAEDGSLIKTAFKQFVLEFAVRQRNIMDLIKGCCDINYTVERHIYYLGGKRNIIKEMYSFIVNDPFFCCQVLNYYSSYKALEPLLSLSLENFKKNLATITTGFYSYQDIDKLVSCQLR